MQINKIAVIGLGSIGTRHFCNVLELGYEAVGYDPDPNARERVKNIAQDSYPQAKFSCIENLQKLLKDCDAVIIANPHKYHLETLSQCVKAGKHCLVEKPLAVSLDGLNEVLAQANDQNLVISIGFNMRFRPVVEVAKNVIDSLGQLYWARFICASYLPDWRSGQDYRTNYTADPETGGVVFDVSHEIDLAYHLFGTGKVVAAYGENSGLLEMKSEDLANVTIKHDSGVLANIHLDYLTKPKQRRFECAGENGMLYVDLQTHRLQIFNTENELLMDEYHAPAFNNYEYIEELKHFLQTVQDGGPAQCGAEDGVRNLELILAARDIFKKNL